MFTKYATAQILSFADNSKVKTAGKKQKLSGFEYEPRNDGHKYMYVAVRACTADVPNLNYDMLPDEELGGKEKYKTFEGAYVYLNHDNMDPAKARGAIIAAKYHDEGDEDGNKWVEILEELDEEKCPKLCSLIRSGDIDTVSMGCSVESTTCSICGNTAEFPYEFCEHVQQKGNIYNGKLAYEICNGIDFFECSWVYNPADPTAHVQALAKEAKSASVKVAVEWYEFDQDHFISEDVQGDCAQVDPKDGGYEVWFMTADDYAISFATELDGKIFPTAQDAMNAAEDYLTRTASKKVGYPDAQFDEVVDMAENELDREDYDSHELQDRALSIAVQVGHQFGLTKDQIERLRRALLMRKWSKCASIGFVEKMNNGRYYLSCGTMDNPEKYFYGSGDTEEDCVRALRESTPDELGVSVGKDYTPCEQILVLEDCFFGERKKDISNCTKEVFEGMKTAQQYRGFYELIGHKMVEDSDGFMTDYCMYRDVDTDEYVFTMGDMELYDPENGYIDHECDSEEEAYEWFRNAAISDKDDKSRSPMDNYADAPRQPDEISTHEDQQACPLCGSLTFDGEYCDVCGYQIPPEGFDDIQLEDEGTYEQYAEDKEEQDREEDPIPNEDELKSEFLSHRISFSC